MFNCVSKKICGEQIVAPRIKHYFFILHLELISGSVDNTGHFRRKLESPEETYADGRIRLLYYINSRF